MKCPFCIGDIHEQASVCPTCNRDIAAPPMLLAERQELVEKRDALRARLADARARLAARRRFSSKTA